MTYLQFHLFFIVPPLLLLAPALPRATARFGRRAAWTLPAVVLIALVYTTPWDNYLVYSGIWWYGTDRVLGTIGHVPVEEYLFFALQPVLTGAWTYRLLLQRTGGGAEPRRDAGSEGRPGRTHVSALEGIGSARAVGVGVYLLLTAGGVLALTYPSGRYLGLVLVWAAPVLATQWFFVADIVSRAPRLLAAAVVPPTLYLWFADRIAIGAGVWTISATATTGLHLFGLPVEEAVFFLVTNLLVVQGILLFLAPALAPAPAEHAAPHPGESRRSRPTRSRPVPARTNGARP